MNRGKKVAFLMAYSLAMLALSAWVNSPVIWMVCGIVVWENTRAFVEWQHEVEGLNE